MSTITDRPHGTDVADPDDWEPSDPSRWAHLNLADPDPAGALPKDALVADALAWALVPAGATDPVEGIVDGVRAELAALAEVHPVSVVRAFRRHTGLTPGAYVRRLRLEAAARALLAGGEPIAQVALEAGFASQAHFTRAFSAHFGRPPGAFRRERGGPR